MSGVRLPSGFEYLFGFIIALVFSSMAFNGFASAASVEIKMDLSYKYKKDDFRVIYKDDSNNEYDVTRKSELNIEEIDTGSGIVRKATANYEGLSDVVHENTYFFEGSSTFQSAFDNMRLVNTYLMSISNKTIVLDILNVKIKKDTYHEGNTALNYGWTPRHNIHVAREVNYIGCNSDNSDYDMPIFDGQDQTHELAIVTANDTEHIYNDRTINFYNIQIQNYENAITLQHQYNSTIKGLVFKDMGDKPFNDNDEICERNIGKCRAEAIIGLDYINNVTVRDTEFRDAYGSSSYFHAIYLSHNVDGAIITNDFFLNTGIDAITMRDNVTNTDISENYLFNVGAVNSDRNYNMCFVSINQSKPTSSKPGEKDSKGNSFCGNWIRNEATDRGHPAITIRPDGGYTNRFYAFENSECSNSGNYGDTLSCKIPECSDDTTKCKLKDYYYPAEWDIEIPDMEPWLKVNSCAKGNTSEISSEEFIPTRNIIKHIDKSGNTLSPNNVIIVNGGENFIAAPRKNLVGVAGDSIYTKEYRVRLYDENDNLITMDANGNKIGDNNGYIDDFTEIALGSLGSSNQTFKFVYTSAKYVEGIEIRMDLSYKYKKDNFRVFYKDDSGNEMDVTDQATLTVSDIDTGSGIVRKAVASYNGFSDTVYEYTVNYDENHNFSAIYDNMKLVNTYLANNGDRRVMDILNIKIKNGTYYGDSYEAKYGRGNYNTNVWREINYIGCNSGSSDYDMPVFDGEGTLSKFFVLGVISSSNNNDARRVNMYNFQVQNYWNGLFYRSHQNGLVKGLVFKDIYTPVGASSCTEALADCMSIAALEPVYAVNNTFEDIEFSGLLGDMRMHAIYLSKNSDGNVFRNNFFLNSDVNSVKMRDGNDNNKFNGNYFFDALNAFDKASGGSEVGYIADVPQGSEETGYGNEFCGNSMRNSDPNHLPITASIYYPAGSPTVFRFRFDNDGNCAQCKLSKDYNFSSTGAFWNAVPGTVSDFDTLIKVNSCLEPNKSSISDEAFMPVRSVVKHLDENGNTVRPNDVIITNGGEEFSFALKPDILKNYGFVRLYDDGGNVIFRDANGNVIADSDGYIAVTNAGVRLASVKNSNQTVRVVYANTRSSLNNGATNGGNNTSNNSGAPAHGNHGADTNVDRHSGVVVWSAGLFGLITFISGVIILRKNS